LFRELESNAMPADFASLEVYLKNTEMKNPDDGCRSTHDVPSAVREYRPERISHQNRRGGIVSPLFSDTSSGMRKCFASDSTRIAGSALPGAK
jgi:hypothetical protein